MTIDERERIAGYFPEDFDSVQLVSIKQLLPDVSYGKLKMVLGWLQKKGKKFSQQL